MGRERMPQSMRRRGLADARLKHGLSHRLLYHCLVKVMPTLGFCLLIVISCWSRESPLPTPFRIRIGVLSSQCKGQHNPPETLAEVSAVPPIDLSQVGEQRFFDRRWKGCDAVLLPLAIANQD